MMQSSRPRLPGPSPSTTFGSSSQQQQPQQQQQQQLYPSLPPQSSQAGPSSQALSQPLQEDPTYGPLERAGKVVSEHLSRDASLVGELGEGLQGASVRLSVSEGYGGLTSRSLFSSRHLVVGIQLPSVVQLCSVRQAQDLLNPGRPVCRVRRYALVEPLAAATCA